MSDSTFQTVRLAGGAHASPAEGACVMELASMLAGERFSDHPRAVCPVIAGFLRSYNDRVPPDELDQLYPLAALVVGSASSWGVRRRRTRRLSEWARAADDGRSGQRLARREARHRIVVAAARAAAGMDSELRRSAVSELVDELVAMGHRTPRPLVALAAPPLAEAGASAPPLHPTQQHDDATAP